MRPGFSLRLNRDEVDEAFEVPLAFLMVPQNHKRESRDWNGLMLTIYAIPFGNRNIGVLPQASSGICTSAFIAGNRGAPFIRLKHVSLS